MMAVVVDQTPGVSDESRLKRLVFPLALVVLMALGGWFIYHSMGGHAGAPKRQTVKIAVLPDTPPPPPPPKEEKKVEPPKEDQKPVPQQEQIKPVETPPEPQQLKMDGPAGDGPSAFSAGQVSSEYKGGEIGSGTGGAAANRMQFAFFTGRLTKHIQTELARNGSLKGLDYRVNVRIWLAAGGAIQRVELLSSTGDDAQDTRLKQALSQVVPVDQVPANLPQPLTLRVSNRVTG